jgi:hypothetical protein
MHRGSLVCCIKLGVETDHLYKSGFVTNFKVIQLFVVWALFLVVVYYNLWLNPKYVNFTGLRGAELISSGYKNQLTCYSIEITGIFNTILYETQLQCSYFVADSGYVSCLGLVHFMIKDGRCGEYKYTYYFELI